MLALRSLVRTVPASARLIPRAKLPGAALPGLALVAALVGTLGFVSPALADPPPEEGASRSHIASVPIEEDAPPVQAMSQTFLLN